MRLLIIFSFLVSCNANTPQEQSNKFEHFVKKLPSLRLPISFNSLNDKYWDQDAESTDSSQLYFHDRFPNLWDFHKVFKTTKYLTVIGIEPADLAVPVLMTFDLKGNKIDSLIFYKKGTIDIGYYPTEVMTIREDRTLEYKDSTLRRRVNSDRTDEIPNSDSVTTITKHFQISGNGNIRVLD